MPISGQHKNLKGLMVDNDQAERLGIYPSQVWAETWKQENANALASYNEWVEKNGLPLSRYRQF